MADVCGEEASAQKIYNYADHETNLEYNDNYRRWVESRIFLAVHRGAKSEAILVVDQVLAKSSG